MASESVYIDILAVYMVLRTFYLFVYSIHIIYIGVNVAVYTLHYE